MFTQTRGLWLKEKTKMIRSSMLDSEDSDSALEEEFKDHGDLDLDSMDDGNLGIRGSSRGTNRSPNSPRGLYTRSKR